MPDLQLSNVSLNLGDQPGHSAEVGFREPGQDHSFGIMVRAMFDYAPDGGEPLDRVTADIKAQAKRLFQQCADAL